MAYKRSVNGCGLRPPVGDTVEFYLLHIRHLIVASADPRLVDDTRLSGKTEI